MTKFSLSCVTTNLKEIWRFSIFSWATSSFENSALCNHFISIYLRLRITTTKSVFAEPFVELHKYIYVVCTYKLYVGPDSDLFFLFVKNGVKF